MNNNANRLTSVAVGLFILLIIAGALGFCGKPSDHKPKPNPSSSVTNKSPVKKSPVPTASKAPRG